MLKTAAILLPSFVTLFWVALFLINGRENSRPQRIWMLFLLFIGVCSQIWSVFYTGIEDYSFYYKLDIVDAFLSLSILPLVYFYFWSLTHDGPMGWKQYACFLPALLIGGCTALFYGLMGDEQSTDFVRHMVESRENYVFPTGSLPWALFLIGWEGYYLFILGQVVVIMSYSTLNAIRYRRGLKHYFSNLDEKAVENNRAVLIGLYVLLLLTLLIYGSRILSPEKYFSVKYVFMVGVGVTLYFMSYYVYKLRFTAGDIILAMEEETKEAIPPTDLHDVYTEILPQFTRLIDEEQIFLQPHITLEEIARQLNSNRTYISRLINEEFQMSFYDYINGKRLAYAKALITQNPQYTRDEIAHASGFLHAQNFSRVFKQQTGLTFSEWRKNVVANEG